MDKALAKAIIIADSHIFEGPLGRSEEFFEMLDAVLKTPWDVVFLGDIFELWIALDGYEDALHKRFLAWCEKAVLTRNLGFVEGNHEYFIGQERTAHFDWTSDSMKLAYDGILFSHGDLINLRDSRYRLMRRLVRNPVSKTALKLLSSIGIGPAIADKFRVALKGTNMEHRRGLPMDLLEAYAAHAESKGAKKAVLGHFHHQLRHQSPSVDVELVMLPSWRDAGHVGVLLKSSCSIETHPWRDILA